LPVSELENRLEELPQDKPIIVYCRSGNRSTSAANILLEKGFKEIFNMTGGITEWQNKGFPVIVEK
ncbi:MAG: rhodanese-like domain-containing protein, partial [Actinobacteria bacterium]|nr:rhodanese-like domain-containing protein [Actinomycetota bacterium]MCG2788676.1 rhodanese-like domain-containing protein [Actinomycetes bacterium]